MAIDVAVLQAKLELDSKKYTASLMKAGRQAKVFEKSMTATSKGLKSQFAGDVFQHQRAGLNKFIGRMKMATGVAAGLAGVIGVKLVKDGIKLNAQWESLNVSFRTFMGSAKGATKFVEKLRKVSKRSPLRLTEYAEGARQLLGFGVASKKVIPLLDALNTAIVGTGKGSEEMMRAVTALGQIEARGKASAEEMGQLMSIGIIDSKALQKELSLTGEQMANIGNESVTSKQLLSALAKTWKEQFGDAFKDAESTFTVRMATLVKNWEQMLRLMTKPLFEELRNQWLPVFNKTANDIIAIWNKPGLTPEEKFKKAGAAIERNFGPLWERVKKKLEQAKIGDKLVKILEAAIPLAAEGMGRGGLLIAKAFFQGFKKSGVWGKIAIAAFLTSKLVGWGNIFSAVGRKVVKAFAARFIPGMAAQGAAGGAAAAGSSGIGSKLGAFSASGSKMGKAFGIAFKVAAVAAILLIANDVRKKLKINLGFGDDVDALTGGSAESLLMELRAKGWTNLGILSGGRVRGTTPGGRTVTRTARAKGGTVQPGELSLVGERGPELVSLPQSGKKIQALAKGGRAKGGMALVGEKGPELAMMPAGTEVFSNRKSKAMAAASGMGVPGLAGGGVVPAVSQLMKMMRERFGLGVSSTTGGKHADKSFHYQGKAADFVGSKLGAASSWIKSSGLYKSLLEGIQNPSLSVKSGGFVSPGFWGADTWAGHTGHLHLAAQSLGGFSDGGGSGGGGSTSGGGKKKTKKTLRKLKAPKLKKPKKPKKLGKLPPEMLESVKAWQDKFGFEYPEQVAQIEQARRLYDQSPLSEGEMGSIIQAAGIKSARDIESAQEELAGGQLSGGEIGDLIGRQTGLLSYIWGPLVQSIDKAKSDLDASIEYMRGVIKKITKQIAHQKKIIKKRRKRITKLRARMKKRKKGGLTKDERRRNDRDKREIGAPDKKGSLKWDVATRKGYKETLKDRRREFTGKRKDFKGESGNLLRSRHNLSAGGFFQAAADASFNLGELKGTKAPSVRKPEEDKPDTSRIDELFKQLYENTAKKLVTSQAQYDVFAGFPQLATGTPSVAREGLAFLHQNEAVIPEKFNPFEGGEMGGGGPIVINFQGETGALMRLLEATADASIDGKKAEIVEGISRDIGETVGLGGQSAGVTAVTAVYR